MNRLFIAVIIAFKVGFGNYDVCKIFIKFERVRPEKAILNIYDI